MEPDERPRAKIWWTLGNHVGREIEHARQRLEADLKPMGLFPVGFPQIEEADDDRLQLSWEVANA